MRSVALTAVAALALGACASSMSMERRDYRSTLSSMSGSRAVASAHAVSMGARTSVGINLAGGESNSTHPWHVHMGTCAQGGGIVGAASAYPALRTNSNGEASATANVEVGLMAGQSYHINVHRSTSDMGTVIACGDLR